MALRTSLFDLDDAYHRFFKEKKGYPKYKNKYGKNSYRTNFITSTYKGNIYVNIKLDLGIKDLSIREYECPKCGSLLDRDYNAAINIMYEGIKRYMKELTA